MDTQIDISPRTLAALVLVFLGLVALVILRDVAIIVFLAVVLATALDPMITRLARIGITRRLSVLLITLVIVAIAVTIVITFAPLLVTQFHQLASAIIRNLDTWANGTDWRTSAIFKGFTAAIPSLPSAVSSAGASLFRGAVGVIMAGLIIALLVYHLAVKPMAFRTLVIRVTPIRSRATARNILDQLDTRLGQWLRGQLTISLVIATLVSIGLAVMRVPYAIPLGLIAGLTEFIPSIGPYIGMLPAILVGVGKNPWLALFIFIMFYVIQQLENNFLAPKIMAQAVGLKPLLIIIALFVGAKLLGLLGFALAVPTCIIVDTVVRNLAVRTPQPS